MANSTPILCRVCKKRLGVVRDFQGKVYGLCPKCEKAIKEAKKAGYRR
jgi:hypothetical protein